MLGVKFVFANSNETVEAKVAKTSSGLDLKKLALTKWPKSLTKCQDPAALRIVCLGRMLNDDDELMGGRSGSSAKLLRSDSLIPINVSVRPAGAPQSPRDQGAAAAAAAAAGASDSAVAEAAGSKSKGKKQPIERDRLGNTPALQEVCQCVIA